MPGVGGSSCGTWRARSSGPSSETCPQLSRSNRRISTTLLTPSDPTSTLNYMVQYLGSLDASFSALSDETRRGILERLGRGDASITELAHNFDMTLTGVKKHVAILESAGLVTTEKVGRVRRCRLGPRRMLDETTWISEYQRMVEARLDRLGAFLKKAQQSSDLTP